MKALAAGGGLPPEAAGTDPLRSYAIEGIRGDAELERIVRFASELCDCPIALVSLVDEAEQHFVARFGLQERATPRSMSFCAHAMHERAIMEVPDATRDPRFRDNPLVTGHPHVRFYAGAPLAGGQGQPLGSLCVISAEPRSGLTDLQRQGLLVLADAVMNRLEARRILLAKQAWEVAAEADLAASEQRFRVLADAMPQMVWSTRPDGYHDYYNARWYAFTGAEPGDTDGTGWNGQFHPDDQARAWATWHASLETGRPYEIEYRLRRFDGVYRWTLGRALPIRDDTGLITRWFGTCTDIHDQRMLREEKDLLSRELSHRIGNIFGVVASLIRLTSRSDPALRSYGRSLSDQITALGRAYDYIHGAEGPSAATLHGMLEDIFAAYNLNGVRRVRIHGDDISLAPRVATPLALTFHELATNAAKYGALSAEHGAVDLTFRLIEGVLELDWVESGGPEAYSTERKGFGTEVISLSIERQLGGWLKREWLPRGLKVTAAIPRQRQ